MHNEVVTITASLGQCGVDSSPKLVGANGPIAATEEDDACSTPVDRVDAPGRGFAALRPLVCVAMVFAAAAITACKSHRAGESDATVTIAGARLSLDGVPSARELDAFVTGAGRPRLGMTEKQVSDALGTPTRRQDPASPGDSTDVVWDHLEGPHPGAALGRFQDGQLIYIEFATTAIALPHVDRAAATSLTEAEIVQRSVAKELRMRNIEAVTRSPGQRMAWTIGRDNGNRASVTSRWAWEIDPGGDYLIVRERDGFVEQPIIRKK